MKHIQVVRLRPNEKVHYFEFELVDYPQIGEGEYFRVPINSSGIPSDQMRVASRFVDGLTGRVVLHVDPIPTSLFDSLLARWKELNGPNAKPDIMVYRLPDIQWRNPR